MDSWSPLEWLHRLRDWTESLAHTPYGGVALFGISLAEASFFPIPPDVLLIALALVRPEWSFWYAGLCTAASVIGGLLGYGIGYFGGRPLLDRMFAADRIRHAHDVFERYEGWAIGIAGLTPIPYKIFTISAGALGVNLPVFVIASVLSRGARFFAVGGLIWLFGAAIESFIDRYFNILAVAFLVMLAAGFVLIRYWARRHAVALEAKEKT
jgi:membrane protein YqaA with SNARE-associated domain